jgi:hypothetical protein
MSAEKKVERRTDEEALPGHVIDVGLHIAAGVGALQVGVAAVEVGAHSGHGLGLERVQDQVSLGREVVVQAAEAEVGGPAAWLMVRRLAPWRSMSGATARKISCWGRRRSSGGWPDFPDMAPSFRGGGLEYRATTAQRHADRRARRPKVAKLATNNALRQYGQNRLSGTIMAPRGPGADHEPAPGRLPR